MYVCTYVRTHARTYVRLSVCLPAWLSACLPVCLSACLPACLPACLSVRMQACTHARMHGCTDAQMHVCTYARMDVWTYGRMDVCTYVRMYVRTYACMHVWMYTHLITCNSITYTYNSTWVHFVQWLWLAKSQSYPFQPKDQETYGYGSRVLTPKKWRYLIWVAICTSSGAELPTPQLVAPSKVRLEVLVPSFDLGSWLLFAYHELCKNLFYINIMGSNRHMMIQHGICGGMFLDIYIQIWLYSIRQ